MKMLSSIQVETTVCLWIKIIVLNLNNEDLLKALNYRNVECPFVKNLLKRQSRSEAQFYEQKFPKNSLKHLNQKKFSLKLS